MKKPLILLNSLFLMAISLQAQIGLEGLPTNPIPGKCYIRCVTPERYEKVERRILARPTYTTLKKIPAEYKTVEERVMVKAASKKYVAYPAEYRTETETYQIEDPYNEITIIPAKLGVKSDTIEVRPRVTRWEYQSSAENCSSDDPRDCMILCYVEHPAEYRDINIKTVESDATFTKVKKGGKSMTVSRQVIAKEARYETIEIPAEYKTITTRKLVMDEDVEKTEIPSEYAIEMIETLQDAGGIAKWDTISCSLTNNNVLPINYELGSARLTSEARSTIDSKLLKLMKDKPDIRVQISSHTDSRGSSESNMSLSQARAEAVVNYLIGRGIQRSRLVARGFGETVLKNSCADGVECSEEEHAKNRRTEFKVLSN
ncbi:MAG: OmpA family protein [Saprospiraceae bacterium]|nr:OmpA family protein [Saprospiraceae bacterium]MCF8250752.1 OmpA family protein [Saprospiraceae bacterium]MCF8279809.1 OmpA family protein [Bacteroidales bacterium]MCF8310486.1 OmpA family protein [Saprospiraceae bacterium]MCF8440882.1 OmpA family protein [Saprospiraceae bacterium]